MNLFYTSDIRNGKALLDKTESHHALRVLKILPGDECLLGDGVGTIYTAIADTVLKNHLQISITGIYSKSNSEEKLHIAIGPTKSLDRFEVFLEKATEAGVDEITPVISFHSERKIYKTERGRRILLSAAKQSLSPWLPVLNEPMAFSQFLESSAHDQRFIAHCNSNMKRHSLSSLSTSGDCTVLIGPEGDFSEQEINQAEASGFKPISLGDKRLRTETAGITVCLLRKVLLPEFNAQ